MKFSAVLFSAALIAGVAAQSTKTTTSEVPVNTNSSYGPEVDKCLDTCKDTNCAATCLGNPNPTEEQVIETTKCAAACPQGNGTEEETKAYGDCQRECTVKYFLPNSDNVPSKTSSTSGPVATDDEGNPVSTDNGTSTSTSTESPTASDDSSAASTIYSTSFAGVVAAFAAFFAL